MHLPHRILPSQTQLINQGANFTVAGYLLHWAISFLGTEFQIIKANCNQEVSRVNLKSVYFMLRHEHAQFIRTNKGDTNIWDCMCIFQVSYIVFVSKLYSGHAGHYPSFVQISREENHREFVVCYGSRCCLFPFVEGKISISGICYEEYCTKNYYLERNVYLGG